VDELGKAIADRPAEDSTGSSPQPPEPHLAREAEEAEGARPS